MSSEKDPLYAQPWLSCDVHLPSKLPGRAPRELRLAFLGLKAQTFDTGASAVWWQSPTKPWHVYSCEEFPLKCTSYLLPQIFKSTNGYPHCCQKTWSCHCFTAIFSVFVLIYMMIKILVPILLAGSTFIALAMLLCIQKMKTFGFSYGP